MGFFLTLMPYDFKFYQNFLLRGAHIFGSVQKSDDFWATPVSLIDFGFKTHILGEKVF